MSVPPGAEKVAKVEVIPPAGDERSGGRFKLVPFHEIKLGDKAVYLVKGIVPRVGLTLVYGPPKSCKSFWVFDLLMHVALGWEYRGRRVKQGAVVYIIMEGADGFRARVEAFRKIFVGKRDDVPFYLVSAPVALVADHKALIAAIRARLGDVINIAAIGLDTVNRSLTGSESSDQDMSNYVRAADQLRDAFACAVVAIHHSGLDASRPRGHTSLTGGCDAQIVVKRNATGQIVTTVEHMKDGSADVELVSTLKVVEVGRDEDGEVITSCIIEPVEGAGVARKSTSTIKLTKGAKIALAALHDALTDMGEVPPASNHIPPGVRCITVERWRDWAYRRGISTSDKYDSRRQAFIRATEGLIAARQVTVWEPYAWPVSST